MHRPVAVVRMAFSMLDGRSPRLQCHGAADSRLTRAHLATNLRALRRRSFGTTACAARAAGGAPKQRRDQRVLNDFYFQEAKRCGYLSRAAFKLMQIDEKCGVIKKGAAVLDLGCFPGAWLQVACQKLGPQRNGGAVVGIDLKEMAVPSTLCDERVTVLHGDARDLRRDALLAHTSGRGFDAVLSDMCHDTMGAGPADVAASLDLCECAANVAVGNRWCMGEDDYAALPAAQGEQLRAWHEGALRSKGALVMKILEGEGTKDFADSLRPFFTKVRFVRPKATRKESREVYIVCTQLL